MYNIYYVYNSWTYMLYKLSAYKDFESCFKTDLIRSLESIGKSKYENFIDVI